MGRRRRRRRWRRADSPPPPSLYVLGVLLLAACLGSLPRASALVATPLSRLWDELQLGWRRRDGEDGRFMQLAINRARGALQSGEVPVGAVIVSGDGKVIGSAGNRVEAESDATAHAEIIAMRIAARSRKNWRLSDCTLYSTLEPCFMCISAAQSFRIPRVVYAADDTSHEAQGGRSRSKGGCSIRAKLYGNMIRKGGVLQDQASELMIDFFRARRLPEK